MIEVNRESRSPPRIRPCVHLKYEDVGDPRSAAGEVLVRVVAAGMNPVDWMLRSGAVKDLIPIELPYILGIDLAGIVLAVGEDVVGFEAGDRVMALASHTYAELCSVKARDLVKIPTGLEMVYAATLPLVNLTGDQLIRLGTNVQPGQIVLITGALGAVGRSAVFAASEIGARVIAGVRGASLHPSIRINSVFAKVDTATTLHYAEAPRDGKLVIPIDRVMPLTAAAEAHAAAENGGVGKIVFTTRWFV
jgi:NADPH:quinone reductase-like Zn-dependent oxidoreductase